jgi:hypothetical protein
VVVADDFWAERGLSEKTAANPAASTIVREEFLKGSGRALALLGGLGAIGIARERLRGRALKTNERENEEHFVNMLKKNPELAVHDIGKVRELFDIMAETSPSFARHPRIAGSWIQSQATYGGSHPPFSSISDLVTAQKLHDQTEHSKLKIPISTQFATGMLSGSGVK